MGVPGPFKIVLQAVERRHSPDTLGDPTAARVKVELARLFDLDEDTASNIIAAIPIVVVEGLDGRQAGVVRDRLRRLGDLGCRVVVTDDASETIPRVNWPELPAIARVADEEPRRDPGTGHGHGARASAGLACPACGAGLSIVLASGSRAVAPNGAPVGANGSAARTPDTAPSRAARDEGRIARPPESDPAQPSRAEPARATPAATARPTAPSHTTDDWLDPPVGAAAVAASAQKSDVRRGTGRFDDASLLAFRGGQPAPPPPPAAFAPPPPPPREAAPQREAAVRTTTIPAAAATARSQPAPQSRGPETQKELAELDVSFTDSGELPRPGAAQPAPALAPSRAPAPAPSRTAAAPSRPSEPDIDIELLDSAEGPAPKKEPPRDSNKKKNTRFDDDDDDDPLAHAFPDEPPKAAVAARASQSQLAQVHARDPFEDSRIVDPAPISGGLLGAGGGSPPPKGRDGRDARGAPPPPPPAAKNDVDSLLDSASDILDAAPPHRRSAPHSASSDGGRRAPDLDGDLDLLDGSGSRLLDSDEPVRRAGGAQAFGAPSPAKEAAKGKAPARKPADDDDDPFEKSVIEDEPPARGKSAPPARGGGSGKRPSIEDVLDMFGPEDEVPLDDGDGLDPPGLDLSPSPSGGGGGRRTKSAPPDEGNELSDILEPLDPGEALQIIKTSKPPRPGRSMPSAVNGAHGNGRDDKSDPSLEALGADEALAILNPGSDPTKKKSRGVPFPASGEDLFEDSSRGSSSKAQKKKTDPFARARKQLASEDDGDPLEASPPARAKKPDSDRRPARGSGADLDAMADDPPAKPSKPGPRPGGAPSKPGAGSAGSGGDGDHGLVLSRIADPDKKEEAAAIIAEVKGCSVEEARRLTDRTIIPVLKGVSREEAELHLEKFKKVKIAGRVTTRQRS